MTFKEQLQAARDAADPVAYYDLLARSGENYAGLAKGVLTSDTYSGYIGRAYAKSVGTSDGVTVTPAQWFQLSVLLMEGDFNARFIGNTQVNLGWPELLKHGSSPG